MDSLLTLVGKVRSALESEQGLDRNLLQEGRGNLEGAEVVFDRDIPAYSVDRKSKSFVRYFENTPIEVDRKDMPRRRITAFRNPDRILLLITDGWFSVGTKADLLTLENYQKQHQKFLKDMGIYGFIHEGERIVSVFQELVDKECKIYEEIVSKYNQSES